MKTFNVIFSSFIFLFSLNIFCEYSLDYLAIKYGADKSSKHHNYINVYEKLFSPIRYDKIDLLEIGIDRLCSAFMWEQYFPFANLYFIDNSKSHIAEGKKKLSQRSKCFLCDQGNKKDLMNFINNAGAMFDIIVDDGGHFSRLQITSFEVLFPYVKKGGIYVIEDLNYSYWGYSGGHGDKVNPRAGKGSSIDFLKGLIDELNYVAATDGCANIEYYPKDKREKLTYYQEHIKAIHFYSSLCIIFKR